MGRRGNRARARDHRLSVNAAYKAGVLKCAYWNARGLKSKAKLEELVGTMNDQKINIMFVDETHHKLGENVDLSALRGYTVHSAERSADSKQGGGKLVVIDRSVFHVRWEPSLQDNAWVNQERMWILVYNGAEKLAFCSVYMAAEVGGARD